MWNSYVFFHNVGLKSVLPTGHVTSRNQNMAVISFIPSGTYIIPGLDNILVCNPWFDGMR